MIARRAGLVVSVAALAILPAGCGRYETPAAGVHSKDAPSVDAGPEPTAVASSTAAETAEGKQTLVVTVRDVPPLSAYQDVDGDCVLLSAEPDSPQLFVRDDATPDVEGEAFDVPAGATMLDDGSCEATFEVTVARADAYDLGVAVPDRGIADPADPRNPPVKATTSPQEVTVLR